MKYAIQFESAKLIKGRSLHGERGLKYPDVRIVELFQLSLPARGAWIEILRVTIYVAIRERGLK